MDVPLNTPPEAAASRLQAKLEAAMILRGVVRIVLDDGQHEVQPRTMYRERGTGYLEAKRRDSGERMRVRLDQIRDVLAY
jgi:hypothetical protein